MPWGSTGWTNNRNVTQMLEYLMMRGEVAIAGRRGRQRLWDLAERVYPADCPILSVDEAHRIKNERRLQSLGIARAKGAAVPVEPADVGDTGDRPPSSASPASGGSTHGHSGSFPRPHSTALLSPFDRLVGKLDAIAHRKSGTLLGALHPRGRPVHPQHDRRRARRDPRNGILATVTPTVLT
jgi:hypothetical protein